MATLHEEMHIEASPDAIWDAVRDVGALHTRLVPGFVVDTKLEGSARIVTFDEMAAPVAAMQEKGLVVMKATLERRA